MNEEEFEVIEDEKEAGETDCRHLYVERRRDIEQVCLRRLYRLYLGLDMFGSDRDVPIGENKSVHPVGSYFQSRRLEEAIHTLVKTL